MLEGTTLVTRTRTRTFTFNVGCIRSPHTEQGEGGMGDLLKMKGFSDSGILMSHIGTGTKLLIHLKELAGVMI